MMTTTIFTGRIRYGFYFSILFFFILLAAGCSSTPKNTPEELIDQFEHAVENHDVDGFMKLATSMDKMYELTKEDARTIIEYFQKEKDIWVSELERLDAMARGKFHSDMYITDSSLLYLTYSEGKWGGAGHYQIGIQPSYITVYTNLKDTTIYVNGQPTTLSKYDEYEKVIGPFVPGEYALRAEYHGDDVTYTSEELTIILPDQHQDKINLSVNAAYVHFDSNYPEADLYLNGEHTGMTVAEANEAKLLIATDGSVTAYAKIKQNDVFLESEPVTIEGFHPYYYLQIPAEYMTVQSSILGAQLFVNGEATPVRLSNIEDTEYGPLVAHSWITIHAEVDSPWGTLISDEQEIYIGENSDAYSYLSFGISNEHLRNTLEHDLEQFIRSGFRALYTYDYEQIQNATEFGRYEALDVLNDTIRSQDAEIKHLWFHMEDSELYGRIHGSTIESMIITQIAIEVLYSYTYTYSSFFGDFVEEIEDVAFIFVTLEYQPNQNQWVVSRVRSMYSYY